MGTFGAHAYAGSIFIIYGLWWTVRILQRWGSRDQTKGAQFRASALYSKPFGRWQLNYEGSVSVILATTGLLIETVLSGPMRGHPIRMHNIQHVLMYFFYGMFGIVALLQSHLKSRIPNFEQFLYILMAMCLTNEGLIFQFHLYGRNSIDSLVHTLLVYTVYTTAAVCLLEMKVRSAMSSLSRAFLIIIHGTWLWAVGFILYNPFNKTRWDPDDHDNLMLIIILYSIVVAVVTIAMILIAVIMTAFRGWRASIEYDLTSPMSGSYSHLLSEQTEEE